MELFEPQSSVLTLVCSETLHRNQLPWARMSYSAFLNLLTGSSVWKTFWTWYCFCWQYTTVPGTLKIRVKWLKNNHVVNFLNRNLCTVVHGTISSTSKNLHLNWCPYTWGPPHMEHRDLKFGNTGKYLTRPLYSGAVLDYVAQSQTTSDSQGTLPCCIIKTAPPVAPVLTPLPGGQLSSKNLLTRMTPNC
jgi:hypothetical protein